MALQPLADDFKVLMDSPDPENIWTCSPGICRLPSGRLIATGGFRGPNIANLEGPKSDTHQGQVFISDDQGESWEMVAKYPFMHARPFYAGSKVYILGHAGDLAVIASDDDGQTWSDTVYLSKDQSWHQAPCSVLYANECVYLVMEREVYSDCKSWTPSVLAPVLMRGRLDADLTKVENWTFASELAFRDAFSDEKMINEGRTFYPINAKADYFAAPGRESAPPGWLETNVFKIYDQDHYWYDPTGRTIHLIARMHNGMTGYGALLKVTEEAPGEGAMTTGFEKLPSGGEYRFIAIPGGQMKFHITYDEPTKLYWLLNTQATDSMTRAEKIGKDRYNLPNNQRSRMVLHFSTNMVDWCFAGVVAMGTSELEARHYASMVIDGDDLCILSRSGDKKAATPHNGNLITFHKLKDFRSLIY